MGRRLLWIALSGVAVLMYLSWVSSPEITSFFLGRGGASLSRSLCRDGQATIACAPGWDIFCLGREGRKMGPVFLLRRLACGRVAVDGPL